MDRRVASGGGPVHEARVRGRGRPPRAGPPARGLLGQRARAIASQRFVDSMPALTPVWTFSASQRFDDSVPAFTFVRIFMALSWGLAPASLEVSFSASRASSRTLSPCSPLYTQGRSSPCTACGIFLGGAPAGSAGRTAACPAHPGGDGRRCLGGAVGTLPGRPRARGFRVSFRVASGRQSTPGNPQARYRTRSPEAPGPFSHVPRRGSAILPEMAGGPGFTRNGPGNSFPRYICIAQRPPL